MLVEINDPVDCTIYANTAGVDSSLAKVRQCQHCKQQTWAKVATCRHCGYNRWETPRLLATLVGLPALATLLAIWAINRA